MKRKKSNTVKVNKLIVLGIILLFCLIIGRLVYIAMNNQVDGLDLAAFAKNRNTVEKTLYANRGTIYDINGETLAQNVNSYNVIAFLSESRTENLANPQHVIDKEDTAEKLSKVLIEINKTMTKEYILGLLNQDKYQVELGPGGRNITEVYKKQIEALALPGISFTSSTKRYYKMSTLAPYIVGYARKNEAGEIVGEMGIESQYNEVLKGENGYTRYERDTYGYQIPNTPSYTQAPESGSNIYLTIDSNVQLMLENALKEFASEYNMSWATMSIMNAKTGAIIGSASNPTFDLNKLNIESYINPLVGYQYEPGSTMKIYSYMAAMENSLYKGSDKYKSGEVKIGKYTVSDWNKVGWGTITYDEGFALSSNTAATSLAQKIGKDNLRDFYKSMGFGSKTGIDLPNEQAGKINFNYDIEVATASFGQGITTTPIQNLQALSVLANSGIMVKPYIVEKIVDENNQTTFQAEKEELGQKISTKTVEEMSKLMYDVVYNGVTTAVYYQPENVEIIGKTGTAEIANPSGGYLTGENDYVRSFAGLFPKEDPQYIIYFSVKQYSGPVSRIARKVAEVIDAVAKTDDSINENIANLDNSKIIKLTNYINSDVEESVAKIKNLKLTPIVLGNGSKVINQYPLKNQTITAGNKVFILTNKKDYLMPDVTGWSTNEIITFCNMIGIDYELNGYGKVKTTSIAKNTKINLEDKIVINLK